MNINCVLIEDEFPAIQLLKKYIDLTKDLTLVATFSDATQALNYLSENAPDGIFLDINIPGMTGLELHQNLPHKPFTILTTAYDQFALEGFNLGAVDYLLKPFSYDRFLISISRLRERLANLAEPSPLKDDSFLWIKSGYKTIKIKPSDIEYIEGLREYVVFHLENGEQIISLTSLKSLESTLENRQFSRIHKSYLVNIKKISIIEKKTLTLGEKRLPIGNMYKTKVLNLFSERLRS